MNVQMLVRMGWRIDTMKSTQGIVTDVNPGLDAIAAHLHSLSSDVLRSRPTIENFIAAGVVERAAQDWLEDYGPFLDDYPWTTEEVLMSISECILTIPITGERAYL